MTTLQPFERRSFAKQRLMPKPAPVIIAIFPSTFIAIVLVVSAGRREERQGAKRDAVLNAFDLLTRKQLADEEPSAAYLYTSQTRQTYRQSVRGAFMMSDDVSSPCIEIPG